jgi:7,8-dihydropterin-6-yl-methyl-4-(beta-D-ribofuranosyl)aminobenzene 5'-phosphate synthase
MIKKFLATILVDDHSDHPALRSEHGFSVWIEADGYCILFDTGQSDLFIRNAEILGIDLHSADLLILSHGHYDHTGGIPELVKYNSSLFAYCHPDVFIPRYCRQMDGIMKPVGINKESENALNRINNCIFHVIGPLYLSANIGITGPIPRRVAFEDTGGPFFVDPLAKNPDSIEDDMAMWVSTDDGLVIVTGCCHSGLINTINHIRSLKNNMPVYAIIGGLHLSQACSGRIESTCDYLQSIGVQRIIPCHCTGKNAIETLEMRFGQKVEQGKAGSRIIDRGNNVNRSLKQ